MVSFYDFVSLFGSFSDWSSFVFLYVDEVSPDTIVNSISEESAKRYHVVSCEVDFNFIRCIISE